MSETHTITINGRKYDRLSGLAVADRVTQTAVATPTFDLPKRITHSTNVHTSTQKSQTLNRRAIKKPVTAPAAASARVRPQVNRSPAITKFAKHPSGDIVPRTRIMQDIAAPQQHPSVLRAHAVRAQQVAAAAPAPVVAPKPAQIIKQQAISEALDRAPAKSAAVHKPAASARRPRHLSVATAALALLLLGGYLTYLNLPSLSVRVAAAQAGVNATYPNYHPDGYSLKGAVAYKEGQVSMEFAANAGPQNFTITQSKSSYDSAAVLDNYVKPKAGDQYTTYNERGLTIYTYNGNAAWVSGGILYTIDGSAPLSGDQIRHLATSL
jgi:hypothetical protein